MTSDPKGRFSYGDLDPVLHERARLGILTALIANRGGLTFARLQSDCSLTAGNLGRHIATLEQAGLIRTEKVFVNRRPQTSCQITDLGRLRLQEYISVLQRVIEDAALGRANPSSLHPVATAV